VHNLNYAGELYGKQIELVFIQKLRDEKKFDSSALLVEQIRRDIEEARKIFGAM
jgi:riboflavin kinase/FMN adenylyltransferase